MKTAVIAILFIFLAFPVLAQNFNETPAESVSTKKDNMTPLTKFFNERVSISVEGQFQDMYQTSAALKHHIAYSRPYVFPIDFHPKVIVPFHVAHLLHLRTRTKLTDKFYLLVRLMLEGQSYCSEYLDRDYNNIIWNKLSVVYQTTFSFLSKADTLYFRFGDLERIRSGEGIVLQDFDGEGYSIAYSFGSFKLQRTKISFGIGLSTGDDIIYSNFSYKDLIFLNEFMDYYTDQLFYLPSISFRIPVIKKSFPSLSFQTDIFGEAGIMDDYIDAFRIDVKRCAFLFGISHSIKAGKNRYTLEAQYRWYGGDFNRTGIGHVADQPYSQLSVDKRFNNWFNYLRAPGNIQGINCYGKFKRYFTSSWFIQSNTEFLKTSGALDQTHFLYETGVGLDIGKNLYLSLFISNKIINEHLRKISLKSKDRWYTYETLQMPTFLQAKEPLFTLRLSFQL